MPVTEPTLLNTWVALFLFFLTCVLFTITNLYTLIFFVEFVNLLVFLLLVCCQTNPQYRTSSSSVSPLVLFFWINALSSVLFFLILLLSSRYGWFSILTQSAGSVFLTTSFFESSWLLFLFFFGLVFIFFLKLGLPPFVFWKLRIFEAAPLWFIAVYNVPYFLFILLILLNTLPLFNTLLSFNAGNSFLLFFIFFTFASIIPLMFLAPNLAYFMTISSGLTVLFLLLFFFTDVVLVTSLDLASVTTSSLYLYLLVYSLLILTLITVLNFLIARSDLISTPGTGSFNFTTLSFMGTVAQRNSSRTYLLTTLINLAGLPPFLVFFFKLRIIVEFLTSGISYLPLLLALVFYLFASIFFYYRTVRLFFSPTGVVRTPNYKAKADLTPINSVKNNVLAFSGAVIFFIFLSICLFPIFVVADLFIYFTGNWSL
uniref:NADH dehydrogenase subunit 2 n=1 Tax=Euplotes vannus TaxID=5939 RepID=UPI002E7630AA|nr:NADH dehydrogenase subunit 2 [Euplotes vannus]UPM52101.1 NADH dehydrogenase subunit 2 [Euplotes vannus]